MVIKTISLLWVGAYLGCGCAPVLQECVPAAYQYTRLMLKTGSSAIIKEYMTLDMQLVLRYLQSGKERLAKSASDVAFEILREAIRRGIENKRGAEKMVPVIAECMIRGMEEVIRSEGSDNRLPILLESGAGLFISKIDRDRIQDAKDTARAWMVLLMVATEPPKRSGIRSGRRSPALSHLVQAWAAALRREAEADAGTIKRVLDDVAHDIREWCEKDKLSSTSSVKAWMQLLHASVRNNTGDAVSVDSTLVSSSMILGLKRAVGNGHRETIKQSLADATASMDQSIRGDDAPSLTAFSTAKELLHSTARSDAQDVAALLEETFVSNTNGTTGSGSEEYRPSPIEPNSVQELSDHSNKNRLQNDPVLELLGQSKPKAQGDPIQELHGQSKSKVQGDPVQELQGHSKPRVQGDPVLELPGHPKPKVHGGQVFELHDIPAQHGARDLHSEVHELASNPIQELPAAP